MTTQEINGLSLSAVQGMTGRNRIDIISQILETTNGGITTKIRIMVKTNLSYAQLKEYLMTLSNKDLLHYDLDTHTFKTTEKGLRFLEIYNKLDHILREEGHQQQQQIWAANLGTQTEKVRK
jgi:predicted transcriptional regulator